tara:strand:- start:3629 stop:3973 length:345 start_codon:yes stop_codon:yes gene_type:complete
MAMIVKELEEKLYAAISSAFNLDNLVPGQEKDDSTTVYEDLARELSIAIDDYIRTATVNVATDISVPLSVSGGSGAPAVSVNGTVNSSGGPLLEPDGTPARNSDKTLILEGGLT